MQKSAMVFAGISGALAVIMGALNAHTFREKVTSGILTAENVGAIETAVHFQLFHTLAILGVVALGDKLPFFNKAILYCFMLGIICFSGSIYFLSTKGLTGFENINWLGPITPLGGLFLIIAWVLLGVSALKYKPVSKQ
jgi:uncharacterized membrane protein YgdD (TMEM256/DUF423 family)